MERPAGKATTRRGKAALEDRQPKLVENPKQILYVHGTNCSQVIQELFRDLNAITKPHSAVFSKKHDIRPFEDALPLENMSAQHDASLFAFGSHNKKRPHNITFVRMFDHHVLDMVELGITNFSLMEEFKNAKFMLGSKPCLAFVGSLFTTSAEFVRIKNLLADFFRGPIVENVNLSGLDHAVVFTAVEGAILLRQYRIVLKKSGTRLPLAELEEIGPSIDFAVRRTQWPSDDLLKMALRQPKELKERKVKNISHGAAGEELGRLHMQKQDLGKLQTRKVKALKRKPEERAAMAKRKRGESDAAPKDDAD